MKNGKDFCIPNKPSQSILNARVNSNLTEFPKKAQEQYSTFREIEFNICSILLLTVSICCFDTGIWMVAQSQKEICSRYKNAYGAKAT